MTAEREKVINEWLGTHCPKCVNNTDRGTEFLNCQAECEVQKDVGIACIHYEEYIESQESMIKDELYDFANWVAEEIFDENWEYNKDAFAELACRKLAKLGIVRAKGDEWELVEPQESEE